MKHISHALAGACIAALVAGCSSAPDDASATGSALAAQCAAMGGTHPVGYATVENAVRVPADAATGMPAFCEVTVAISPVPGSHIQSIYRLPDGWNGRMLGLGGGGWAGQIALFPTRPNVLTASVGLPRGYAVAQTDAGHPTGTPFDPGWVTGNPEAVTDFSHRGIHETAVVGKHVVARYYGKPAARNYFQGCSTGGRMAMMETQRYPGDYSGVIAGAPVYTTMVQTSGLVRERFFRAPGAQISRALLRKVNDAVLSACDADDGLADGVLSNPHACAWQPASMQCRAGSDPQACLTVPQVQALQQAYRTLRTSAGLVGHFALTRGSEAGWNPFVATNADEARNASNGALGALTPLIFGREGFDLATFDVEQHQALVHQTPFAAEYEAASTDLAPFIDRGGKLLLWHGMDDPGPSALATQDYYERAVAANGSAGLRFYAAPGVYHCGGGPGADQMDLLTAMQGWVEQGKAPRDLVAHNTELGFERPLCEGARKAHYVAGDANVASSFRCE
jgi:feruloyl esterase